MLLLLYHTTVFDNLSPGSVSHQVSVALEFPPSIKSSFYVIQNYFLTNIQQTFIDLLVLV